MTPAEWLSTQEGHRWQSRYLERHVAGYYFHGLFGFKTDDDEAGDSWHFRPEKQEDPTPPERV